MTEKVPYKKLFVSHASKDKAFGDILVNLLRGIGMDRSQIIYTSDPQYGTPINENIFTYLKRQINEDAYMLYLLSDNYYKSVACLNEMGAAWVWQNDFTMLMAPGFDTDNPKFRQGVADQNKIAVPLDNRLRMKEFVRGIVDAFKLNVTEENISKAYERYFEELDEIMKIQGIDYTVKLANVERRIRRTPQKPELYHNKGYLLYDIDNDNYPESVQNLLYAIYLNPDYSEAYYRLIQVAGVYGEGSRSLAVANEAVRRFPRNAHSYGCRAFAWRIMGNNEEAIRDANEAIRRKPDKWYYLIRGLSFLEQGELGAALSDFWDSYKMDNGYQDAIVRIKNLSKQMGIEKMFQKAKEVKSQAGKEKTEQKIEESRKYFECILLSEPTSQKVWLEYGGLYYDVGQWDKALAHWTHLLELKKMDYYYWLCALTCSQMRENSEKNRFCRLGLECPDTGYHGKLQELQDQP